jgi:hypothetical protein
MSNVKELITNLLNERISKRVESLEKRFEREEEDLRQIKINLDNYNCKFYIHK